MRIRSLILLGGLAGCDVAPQVSEGQPAEQPTAHTQAHQALMGSASYQSDCTVAMRSANNLARRYGRAAAASDAFVACMDTTMRTGLNGMGPYLECNGDPFHGQTIDVQIDAAIRMARSPNDLAIACTGGGGIASTSMNAGYGHTQDEAFNWSGWLAGVVSKLHLPVCTAAQRANGDTSNCRWAAAPWPYTQMADVTWQQASYTHGYGHGHNNDNAAAQVACGQQGAASFDFQRNTLPYIMGSCINQVINAGATCAGGLEATRCGDNAVQLPTALGATTCECVADPFASSGVALLAGEGTNDLSMPLFVTRDTWMNNTWRPTGDLVVEGGGDFNGDGRPDLLLREDGGQGDLVMAREDGARGVVRYAHRWPGSAAGSWQFAASDRIEGVGNLDGWLDHEVIISSNWGLGVIGYYGGNWNSYALHAYGTNLGAGWTLASTDTIAASADFDGDGRDEMLLQAANGDLAIVDLSGSALSVQVRVNQGSSIGGWSVGAADVVAHTGDLNGDGRDDWIVTSGWGMGILGMDANQTLDDRLLVPWFSWAGDWGFWPSDRFEAVADFDGDGRDDLLMRDTARMRLLTLQNGSFDALATAQTGDRIGGEWLLNANDEVIGATDLYASGRAAIGLRSGWGIGVVELRPQGLEARALAEFGRFADAWPLTASDSVNGTAQTVSGKGALILSR